MAKQVEEIEVDFRAIERDILQLASDLPVHHESLPVRDQSEAHHVANLLDDAVDKLRQAKRILKE